MKESPSGEYSLHELTFHSLNLYLHDPLTRTAKMHITSFKPLDKSKPVRGLPFTNQSARQGITQNAQISNLVIFFFTEFFNQPLHILPRHTSNDMNCRKFRYAKTPIL